MAKYEFDPLILAVRGKNPGSNIVFSTNEKGTIFSRKYIPNPNQANSTAQGDVRVAMSTASQVKRVAGPTRRDEYAAYVVGGVSVGVGLDQAGNVINEMRYGISWGDHILQGMKNCMTIPLPSGKTYAEERRDEFIAFTNADQDTWHTTATGANNEGFTGVAIDYSRLTTGLSAGLVAYWFLYWISQQTQITTWTLPAAGQPAATDAALWIGWWGT